MLMHRFNPEETHQREGIPASAISPVFKGGMKSGLIFDFDGVIADSEVLAGTILAKFVTDLGSSDHPE